MSIQVDPEEVYVDDPYTIWGRLTDATSGAGLPGRNVNIYVNSSPRTTSVTDALGYYSASTQETVKGTYSVQAYFLGD